MTPKGSSGRGRGGGVRNPATGEVVTRAQYAQIKAEEEKYVSELASKGEMPREPHGRLGTADSRKLVIDAYEIIDRNYAMPSQEYLTSVGVSIGTWGKRNIDGIGAVRSVLIEEKKYRGGFVRYSSHYVTVPYRASKSAMDGALKMNLWYTLKNSRGFRKSEFKLPKKKG